MIIIDTVTAQLIGTILLQYYIQIVVKVNHRMNGMIIINQSKHINHMLADVQLFRNDIIMINTRQQIVTTEIGSIIIDTEKDVVFMEKWKKWLMSKQ